MWFPTGWELPALGNDAFGKGALLSTTVDDNIGTIAPRTAVACCTAELICQRFPERFNFDMGVIFRACDIEGISQNDPALRRDAIGALVATAKFAAFFRLMVDGNLRRRRLRKTALCAGKNQDQQE